MGHEKRKAMDMKFNTCLLTLSAAVLLVCSVSCTDKKTEYAKGGGVESETVMPLVPEEGKAGFVLDSESSSLRVRIGGDRHVFTEEDEIYLRSEVFHPSVDASGRATLAVPESQTGQYRMFCYPKGSKGWFLPEGYPLRNLIIPYSQFYLSTVDQLDTYPLYGEYSEATGNRIVFREVIAALDITLRGNVSVASVHVRNRAESGDVADNLAGVASWSVKDGYVLEEGVNFVNLNCTNDGQGVRLTTSGTHFYLLISKGSYPAGLTLTVTDMGHKGQTFTIPAFTVGAGELRSFDFDYAPDADLVFFEPFDNYVWGGNVQGNSGVSAYAPTETANPNENPTERTGYENAFVKVVNTTPGSAFIQANWATVQDWTVGERHSVSAEYVASRNIGDWPYLYRCQEFQGCVCAGGGDEIRGVFRSPGFPQFSDGLYDLTVSYDVCFRYGTEDEFCTQVIGGGCVTSVLIDGQPLELETSLDGNNIYTHAFSNTCLFRRRDVKEPSSEIYGDGWHHVEMVVSNVTDQSSFGILGYDTGTSIKHGHFIDNFEIRAAKHTGPSNRLRVLLFNVQNGMWADQANNFDNFVQWMKKWDADVCIFCESQSIYEDGTSTATGTANWRLVKDMRKKRSDSDATTELKNDDGWGSLARRWGHSYHAISGYRDNYPQVITSKYNITTVRRIVEGNTSGKYIQHGAGYFRVTVGGQVINIVTCHLWPQLYKPGSDDPATSAAKLEGRDYQKYEAESIMKRIVKANASQTNWLLMGDTNAISPVDELYYDAHGTYEDKGAEYKRKWLFAHEVFRSSDYDVQLYDMVREGALSPYQGPGRFITSTGGAGRIDIMYGSEAMRRRVTTCALTVLDQWSSIVEDPSLDPETMQHFYRPSDHRPILVEFDMSK